MHVWLISLDFCFGKHEMYLVEIIQFHFSFLETNKLRLFGVDKNIRPIEKSHACQRVVYYPNKRGKENEEKLNERFSSVLLATCSQFEFLLCETVCFR